jgi:hypothetical protein
LKKRRKNSCQTGFGLSAEAQPECVKVFWFLFSKKHRLLCRLPAVEAISIPGQLQNLLIVLASAFPERLGLVRQADPRG